MSHTKAADGLEYDAFENLTKMTNNAGESTEYVLDVLNRTREIRYPNSDTETFQFDNRSNLTLWNRGGQETQYTYDELSRLRSLDSPDTGDHLAWNYDELDRVETMQDSSGTETTYSYTENDLLESIFRGDGTGIRYGYDQNDLLQSVQDHEGDTTAYTRNERNEVTSVTHDNRTVAYGYDLVGRRTSTDLPNGIHCQRAFDERNRLIFLNYQKGCNPVLTYKYGHNQLGQRIVEEKNSAEQCKLTRYDYNPRRELVKSDRRVGNGCHTVTKYRYDLNHNRIGQNQFTYQHNNADQLTDYSGPADAVQLAYNTQGQATNVGGYTFRYNQSQQIKEASGDFGSSTYFYDGSGRRVAKEVNGNREDYLLLGSEVLKTFANGGLKARYFLGLGREAIQTDGEWKYYLTDGLGSTVALTDESGNSVAAYDYGDYGETSQIAGDTRLYNPYLYTGQEWDAELDMYNLRARHYKPTLGRFIARDPIGYGGGANLYAYCMGDPINWVDPEGTDVLVIYSGPIASNPAGHIGIAIEGHGVYSYRTTHDWGSGIYEYLNWSTANEDKSRGRTTWAIEIQTSSTEDDQLAIDAVKEGKLAFNSGVHGDPHNCANFTFNLIGRFGVIETPGANYLPPAVYHAAKKGTQTTEGRSSPDFGQNGEMTFQKGVKVQRNSMLDKYNKR